MKNKGREVYSLLAIILGQFAKIVNIEEDFNVKKSKKFVVGIILTVIGALGIIGSMSNGVALFGSGILLIIGLLLIYYSKKGNPQDDNIQPSIQNNTAQSPISQMTNFEFNLAGVTFKNDDGKSRQTLLRKLNFKDEPFSEKVNFSLEKYKFNNEDAIRVLANGEDIGNVPRKNINYVLYNYNNISDIQILTTGGGKTTDGEQINYGGKVLLSIKSNSATVKNTQNSRIVYYVANSKKYHYDRNCGGMKNCKCINENQAKRNGMTLCKKCENSFNKYLHS